MKKANMFVCITIIAAIILLSAGAGTLAMSANKKSGKIAASPIIYSVSLNGRDYSLQAYAINGSHFFKLRDIAMILSGTKKQFEVEWDSSDNTVQITSCRPYEKLGSELTFTEGIKTASPSAFEIYIDGNRVTYSNYYIDGNNYIPLSDLTGRMDISAEIDTENRKVSISNSKSLLSNDGYALTLVADNDEALLNGESKSLATPPYIQNGIFYMPLEAVTKLLGGTYSFENNIATVELSGNTTKYQIGSHTVIINGEAFEVSGSRTDFSKEWDTVEIDDNYAPLVLNNTVFIPASFTDRCYPRSGSPSIAWAHPCPISRMVILGEFENERGVDEVKLMDFYDTLPEDFKSQLQYAGVVGEVINYSIEEYQNDDIQVYVMHINEPYEDRENMDGRVCAINVVGNGYSTPRSLKTGDSEDRARLLYGYERFTGSFSYKVENGLVTAFNFYTRYYGSQFGNL